MILSLFTNSDYNKRILRDVKNGSEYIGKKANPVYNDTKKKARIYENQNNFLTVKLSTV